MKSRVRFGAARYLILSTALIFSLVAGAPSAQATACTPSSTTSANGYTTVEFDNPNAAGGAALNCTWSAPLGVTSLYVVVVGGGGSGGWGNQAGGGGGGEVLYTKSEITTTSGASHTIIVGTGGAMAPNSSNNYGNSGGQSSFDGNTANGGGGGGGGGPYSGDINKGVPGGGSSGGGSRFGLSTWPPTLLTATGWVALGSQGGTGAGRQDNNPGVSNQTGNANCFLYGAGGGGGGAMSNGGNAVATCTGSSPSDSINVVSGAGGAGAAILGYCLGGGGGSSYVVSSSDSGTVTASNPGATPCIDVNTLASVPGSVSGGAYGTPGTANTGGGGAGGVSGAGSSIGANGVVIVRYYLGITSGLIASFDAQNPASYPGSGSTWNDLSGNSYNATLASTSAVTKSSSNGGYLNFDGTTSSYATLPNIPNTVTFSGLTVSFYTNFGTATSWGRIIDFGAGQANNNILVARDGLTNDLHSAIVTDGQNSSYCEYTGAISTGSWHHYAVIFDGSDCRLYKDNVLWSGTVVKQKVVAGANTNPTTITQVPPAILRNSNFIGKSNWADSLFQGGIRNIAIYNRALSATEVGIEYNFQTNITSPAINSLSITSTPIGASYQNGETVTVTTVWNETVTATSAPRIPILGLSSKYLAYTTGSGTKTLTFTYVVGASDSAPTGIGLTSNSFDTSTGTITDYNYNATNYNFSAISVSSAQKVGKLTVTMALALAGNATSATYRVPIVITATVSAPGKVTFMFQGKPIPGCKGVPTVSSGSITATCTWRPAQHALVPIVATIAPNAGYVPTTTSTLLVNVVGRSGNR